jgi:hypothetical protein
MTKTLRIEPRTRLENLGEWRAALGQPVTFKVTRESSFVPSLEGVALGLLGELADACQGQLEIDCDYLRNGGETPADLGLFDSLFGLSLVSRAARFRGDDHDLRSRLLATIWGKALDGRVGGPQGSRSYLICRDPDGSGPAGLRATDGEFPMRDHFRAALRRGLIALRFSKGLSESEEDLVTFLYEAARNAYEHGRVSRTGEPVRGYRGVVTERFEVPSDASARPDPVLPEYLQRYVARESSSIPGTRIFFSFTVADVGAGIHHTLPSRPGESPFDRLVRAFLPTESRKPHGGDMEVGLGLARVQASAQRLKALLFVKSSELLAVADFASGTRVEGSPLQRIDDVGEQDSRSRGTALTLVWPRTPAGGDQPSLFQ